MKFFLVTLFYGEMHLVSVEINLEQPCCPAHYRQQRAMGAFPVCLDI